MKSVLFVLNSPTGGAALSAKAVMKELKERGYKCYVVCPPNNYHSPESVYGEVAEEVVSLFMRSWDQQYRAYWLKRPALFAYYMLKTRAHFRPVSTIIKLIKKWDIDIVHTNTALTLDGAIAAKITNTPHVWHIRETIGKSELRRWPIPEPLLATIFEALSTRIIANSEFTARFFIRNGVRTKLQTIYNGIRLDDFSRQAQDTQGLRQEWKVSRNEVLFGMVANITSHFKGHDLFIQAASDLIKSGIDAKFALIGFDPAQQSGYKSDNSYAQSLRKLVRDLDMDSHIIWAGYQDDIPSVMQALDVLVHPCEHESFGRIAAEAAASSKPAIVARGGGIQEIVEHDVSGYKVRPKDIDGFAEAMKSLATNPVLRSAFGVAGRQRAESYFSLDKCVGDIEMVYRSL